MDKVLLVFLGGGIGSVLRYLVQFMLEHPGAPPGRWPWATLAVNLLGSALAGALVALASTRLDEHARLLLAVGLLGGFTTFSAMSADTLRLAEHSGLRAAAYVAVTNAAALAAAWTAFAITRTALGPHTP